MNCRLSLMRSRSARRNAPIRATARKSAVCLQYAAFVVALAVWWGTVQAGFCAEFLDTNARKATVSEGFFNPLKYIPGVSRRVLGRTQVSLDDRDQRYEAIVRFPDGNTQHVQVRAQEFYRARDMIRTTYCQERDCIVEGPWVAH